jgi:SpoIID/LytB domain protein
MINPLETFFEEQLREWPLAHDNHDALTRVWSRELTSDKLAIPLRVQYNPARIVSTGANIDKASIAARPCFLCAKNRPAEQRAMPLNADFEWLVNPFPILPHHYTIAAKVHRPQRILDAYDAMIQATLALPEEYIVFYNGPKCGASAPDHLHLQAGIFDCQLLTANYPYKTLLADSKESFRKIYDSLPVTDGEEEPRMNVIAFRKGNHVSLIVIPRRAHRPHCYTAEGDKHYLISPGALDMGGLIVTPRREDYDRLTADKALDILCEVGVRTEPTIDVGIMQGKEIEFTLNSPYHLRDSLRQGTFTAHLTGEGIVLDGTTHDSIELTPCDASATFSLHGVTIGKEFHWQQQETQTFQGSLVLRIIEGELHAINRIAIEDYLTSVIASEMSGTSSVELLKAHAVISRSWLLAQMSPKLKIENSKLKVGQVCNDIDSPPEANFQLSTFNSQLIKWYDREAHTHFDVCADDHCQRYQGVSRKVTAQVLEAIRATRGTVLSYEGEVCDARFSKCCGGITELYESCWDDTPHPYLSVVHDPFCNTDDPKILSEVLNHYDQDTDFYRWTVQYTQQELSELVRRRGGFDYGDIVDLIPIERGPSGRIIRLQIVGTKATRIIGKELEIRRTLSESHLYSSAFEVEKTVDGNFILHGSGWGHGVGLCQIGAAVMGAQGYNYMEILRHYYPQAELTQWYN